ncbi:hypothetical protein [Nonomuraea indica]|uniref:hypothetical protein n=1 Tax=Nonomuraea indica TaxID=1581193 RepID=UPI000C7D691B|nr:hypothetical protein [Nonomuraea indica]
MAYDGPDDLLQMRRDFVAAERKLAELGRAEPFNREAWEATYARAQELAVEIQRSPWLAAAENRHKAWTLLRDAAAEG